MTQHHQHQHNPHWAQLNERGNRFALTSTRYLVKYWPRWLLFPIVMIIVTYYFLTSKTARSNVATYQKKLGRYYPELQPVLQAGEKIKRRSIFKQFFAFGESIVDRFAVWQGKISYDDLIVHDPDNIYDDMDNPEQGAPGQLFICSHLGNFEISRALVSQHPNFVLNVLMHTKHAAVFNAVLDASGRMSERIRVIQVEDLSIDLMMNLYSKVRQGEWLAIAADRVPVSGEKIVTAPFLGEPATWPQGPWLLAQLLKVKVNTLFCFKQNGQYNLYLKRFADSLNSPRSQREKAIIQAVNDYAEIVATKCYAHPWQWFNFYSFWEQTNEREEDIKS